MFRRKLLRRERDQSSQMRAGRVSHQAYSVGIDGKLARFGAHELNGGFDVAYGTGIGLHAGLHQPVIDCEHAKAVAREVIAPMRVVLASTDLPAAPMNRDHERRPVEAFWHVKIANEPHPIMLRELDPVMDAHFELASHGPLLPLSH